MDRKGTVEIGDNWVAPVGFERSTPRAVMLTGKGKCFRAFQIVMIAVSAVSGIGLGWVAAGEAARLRSFHAEAAITSGIVGNTWSTQGDSPETWISYRFEVEGRAYAGRSPIPRSLWQKLRAGSQVRVEYLPGHPEKNQAVGASASDMQPWVPVLLFVLFALIGSAMGWHLGKHRRLLEEGRAAPGIVTDHGKLRRGSHGKSLGKKYRYRFLLLSGASCKGKAGPIPNPPEIGSTVTIVYDRDNPSRNAPYPFLLVKLR